MLETEYRYTPMRMSMIKNNISILDIAKKFYDVKKKNSKLYSLVEHDSCMIYPETNSFYRFSTGEGGDVVKFLQVMPEIQWSFKEAFNYCYKQVSHLEKDYKKSDRYTTQSKNGQKERLTDEQKKERYEALVMPAYDIINAIDKLRDTREDHIAVEDQTPEIREYNEFISTQWNKAATLVIDIKNHVNYDHPVETKLYKEKYAELKQIALESMEMTQFQSTNKNAIAYLIQERKINSELVFDLLKKGFIRQSNRKVTLEDGTTFENRYVSFTNINKNNSIDSIMSRICSSYSNAVVKKYESPYNSGRGWLLDKNESGLYHGVSGEKKPLIVFEGVIDMLSYMSYQLEVGKLDRCAYLALGGVKPMVLSSILQDKQQQYSQLVLAVDNDKYGDLFCDKVVERYGNDYKITRIKSQYKDWNEDRQNNIQPKKQVSRQVKKQIER